ncbi:MAG: 50S ribosomal protein L11 methyltransferase [Gammaproteobacteria bacterium]|nr:50S ribosomal protein L11 methyltransferase [Gammaproteobacteria bacterium]
MKWKQLKIQTSAKDADMITEILEEANALAISFTDSENQPIFEPDLDTTPLWNKLTITALFDYETNFTSIKKQLTSFNCEINQEIIQDKNWQKEATKDFKPIKFAENLWVCPTWCESPNKNAVNIRLDPGIAFGTGTHPTTHLCLEWLAANIKGGETVIDYGCGSGILAIAALKLGAKEVYAVDIDQQALDATDNNAKKNNIDDAQLKLFLPEQLPAIKADILVANILANPLIELSKTFYSLLKPNGKFVLSGILQEQQQKVASHYQQDFTIQQINQREEWISIAGTKN